MGRIQAMVLAGGRGKRMNILCHARPKPALPFAGRFRVIDFSLSNCVHSGIGDIAVLTDYQRSHMANYLRQWGQMQRGGLDLRVLEPKAGAYKGTADAVYQNLDYLKKTDAEIVLVLAGDHVYKMDYRKMVAFHEQTKADATVGVVRIPLEQAHRFGTMALDADGRIIDFVEKSRTPVSNIASMGIYIFNKEVLSRRLKEDAALADSPHDFGYAIIPGMINRDRVYAYEYDGYWEDIGTPQAYYAANMKLACMKPDFSMNGNWPIFTPEQNSPLPKISREGSVKASLVGAGCVIKGQVENSVLSSGVWVEEKAVIRNSVLMANVFVGFHSVVDSCILDEDVNVGKFCYLGFGGVLIPGEWDITILGRGVAVPAHTAIGRSCKIQPYVGTSDFTCSVIPSGTILAPRTRDDSPLVKEGVLR